MPSPLALPSDDDTKTPYCSVTAHVLIRGSRPDTHAPLHAVNPALHVNPQRAPVQVATPFAGAEHGVHDAPHVVTDVLSAHALPHA